MPGSDKNETRSTASVLAERLAFYGVFFGIAVFLLWMSIRSGRISMATGRPHAWDEPYSWFGALWLPAVFAMWEAGKWALGKTRNTSERS